tara:strand:- start:51 stop:374 length:324 start_codon:yes stop_codon:yes gene_type:complete
MAQGGFARDHQRAAMARIKKEQEELKKSREIIANDVTNRILPDMVSRVNTHLNTEIIRIEEKLVLKQDEVVSEFIQMTYERNKLLKFLLWTNAVTLLGLSFTLGYFL